MSTRKKIMTRQEFLSWRTLHRQSKVVFTNGCFDILHPGHVDYLEQARAMGDILVVGINSDDSVKRIKGRGRPVNPVMDRARVLAGLECVGCIIIFDEDTPYELISTVLPHVLIKGGDWPLESIVGRDIVQAQGGEVLSIELTSGYSTTGIISRIKHG